MSTRDIQLSEFSKYLNYFISLISVGFVGLLCYSVQFYLYPTQALSVFSIGLMVILSSLVVGIFIGFLFGIPRTNFNKELKPNNIDTSNQSDEYPIYQPNTNLEQISDWLTKILVGIGLTQLNKIPQNVENLANYFSQGLGDTPSSKSFTFALLTYFFVTGFISGYLGTRLFLAFALRTVDTYTSNLKDKIEEVDNKFKTQAERDAKALSRVSEILSGALELKEIQQEQLDQIVSSASDTTKINIWYQAHETRRLSFQLDKIKSEAKLSGEEDGKYRISRTVPVFRALVNSINNQTQPEIRERYHAELGYALKDQKYPNFKESIRELDQAIEIRDQKLFFAEDKKEIYPWYEFNKSICLISIDNSEHSNEEQENLRNQILRNLEFSLANERMKNNILADSLICNWLSSNFKNSNSLDLLKNYSKVEEFIKNELWKKE
ncbi:MAG TPA: hypothetical protein VK203_27120 [Nostocaceae cyanobacterium]|nr:hypothetical protein [Nostocaceae cyanobacterium]